MTLSPLRVVAVCGLMLAACGQALAEPAVMEPQAEKTASLPKLVDRGIGFLRSTQAEDGSWSSFAGSGVTSLTATSLLSHGRTPQDPVVAKAIEYILSHRQKDGGIYVTGTMYRNYETCLAIMCLAQANRDGKYDEVLAGAEKFVKELQWDEGEEQDPSSFSYGGAGYGKHGRPDMSNTGFLLEALTSLGRDENDPNVKKALAFVSRCQNLETEHNTTPHAAKVEDGGFYYTAAAGGQSQAGETANGGLRSYGSMTYVGLKSMLYAGVDKDDQRVKAANDWIRRHYTLEQNPGIGDAGLFYYYHTFAKALQVMKEPTVVDAEGVAHDWRAELIAKFAKTQKADGSWTNTNERWLESDPNLVTAYTLLALSHCKEAK